LTVLNSHLDPTAVQLNEEHDLACSAIQSQSRVAALGGFN
jgi:hypothetical protein